jgi:hypothetical protein
MRMLSFVGALLLTSATALSAQSPALAAPTLTLKFLSPSVEAAVATVARAAGVQIQWDESVPAEVRVRPLSEGPILMVDASPERVLTFVTSRHGLAFTVVDAKTVRIHAKPR